MVQKAENRPGHVELYYRLWNCPEVMINVGFPDGLKVSREKIAKLIETKNIHILDALLVVIRKENDVPIGEAKLGKPDKDKIAQTDIKLLPEFWGNGYGTEIKRGLAKYLFANTDCTGVKATPNRKNIASQRMQEKIGGRRVGEGVYRFPEKMRDYTEDVHYYEYVVYRDDFIL